MYRNSITAQQVVDAVEADLIDQPDMLRYLRSHRGLYEKYAFSQITHRLPKTYSNLMDELRWLGPASVMKLVHDGNTRQCGESAYTVTQYLIERGFIARTDAGAGQYCDHFDLVVHTADRGWVSIDPTYIQFHAPNNETHALDIAAKKLNITDVHSLPDDQQDKLVATFFEPTVEWSVSGMLDGIKAFEIAPAQHIKKEILPSKAEAPSPLLRIESWYDYWNRYRKMAENLIRDGRRPMGKKETYWITELARRLRGKTLSNE